MTINYTEIQEQAQSQEQYSEATDAYRSSHVNTMSGFDIVVELYKGIIKNVEHAKESYKIGRLDDMCTQIEKTNKILVALQAHLNFDNGGEAADTLNNFYNNTFASLAQVLRKPNPEDEFDKVLRSIQPVYEIWCKHAVNEKEHPTK